MRPTLSGPLSRRARGIDRSVGLILAVSFVALIVGLLLPAITVRSLFFSRELSLIESVLAFLDNGDWFLFVITFLFSVAFPVMKIITGLAFWYFLDATDSYAGPVIGWLALFSKWSMLDVFIIALIVLVADGRLLSSADIKVGAIVFSGAVLSSTWAMKRLSMLAGN
jgi:paraquat-inducible protein A